MQLQSFDARTRLNARQGMQPAVGSNAYSLYAPRRLSEPGKVSVYMQRCAILVADCEQVMISITSVAAAGASTTQRGSAMLEGGSRPKVDSVGTARLQGNHQLTGSAVGARIQIGLSSSEVSSTLPRTGCDRFTAWQCFCQGR